MSTSSFPDIGSVTVEEVRQRRAEIGAFLLAYRSGIDEIETKLRVLQREFTHANSYNPIEAITSRLKSVESLVRKARRRECTDLESIRAQITDVAGVRVVCSFTADVYRVRNLLVQQDDVTLLQEKDYIAAPKGNGYRSLHLIVQVPVFLASGPQLVPVEVQLRTIAMDFWASLEHKIYYKYDGEVPAELLCQLTDAAATASQLDADMERLHHEIGALREAGATNTDLVPEMLQLMAYVHEAVNED